MSECSSDRSSERCVFSTSDCLWRPCFGMVLFVFSRFVSSCRCCIVQSWVEGNCNLLDAYMLHASWIMAS